MAFYMKKSGWNIQRVVQSLIDNKKIENVSDKDVKIFLSYANPTNTMSDQVQNKLDSTSPVSLSRNKKQNVKFVLTPKKKNIKMLNYGSDEENDNKK